MSDEREAQCELVHGDDELWPAGECVGRTSADAPVHYGACRAYRCIPSGDDPNDCEETVLCLLLSDY